MLGFRMKADDSFGTRSRWLLILVPPLVVILVLGFGLWPASQLVHNRTLLPALSSADSAKAAGLRGLTVSAAAALALPSNQTLMGNGGFNVIRNLYFLNGDFLLVGDAADFRLERIATGRRQCKSVPYQLKNVSVSEARALFADKPTVQISQASLIFFEVMAPKECKYIASFMAHFFHFMEYFQGVWLSYTTYGVSPAPVQLILFPDTRDHKWIGRAPQHLNQYLLRSLFPNALQAGPAFLDSFPNQIVHFELVVTADRAAAHKTEAVGKVNKMLADIHPLIVQKGSIGALRASLASAFGAKPKAPSSKKSVCFINRSRTTRRLDPDDRERFLDSLARNPRFEVKDLFMEDYTFPEQFKIVYNCDALVSLHGNGMTHSLWLPDHAVLIEIFNAGSHTLDFEYFAAARGIQYFAYDAGSGPLSDDERHTNTPRGNVSPRDAINVTNVESLVALVTEKVH